MTPPNGQPPVLDPETSEGRSIAAMTSAYESLPPVQDFSGMYEKREEDIDDQLLEAQSRAEDSNQKAMGDLLGAAIGAALGAAFDGSRGAAIGAGGAATSLLERRKQENESMEKILSELRKRKAKAQDDRIEESIRVGERTENRQGDFLKSLSRIYGRSKIINQVGGKGKLGMTPQQKAQLSAEFASMKDAAQWHNKVIKEVQGKTAIEIHGMLVNPKSALFDLRNKMVPLAGKAMAAAGVAPISELELESGEKAIGVPPAGVMARFNPMNAIDGDTIARRVNGFFAPLYQSFDTKTSVMDNFMRENEEYVELGFSEMRKDVQALASQAETRVDNPNLPVIDVRDYPDSLKGQEAARAASIKAVPKVGGKFILIDRNGMARVVPRSQ